MSRRAKAFAKDLGSSSAPRLDASRLTRGGFAWLTPNRVVLACRVLLSALVLLELVVGPEGLGSTGPRFILAYGIAIVALPALPRIRGPYLGLGLGLLFGVRWAFAPVDSATAKMLVVQLVGIVCAIAPVYARNVGRLAGSIEGHISFTERRTMWRQRSSEVPRAQTPAAARPEPVSPTPAIALLDYRPETGD